MSLSPELRDRITELVQSNSVVLFMKGNRHQPQCGFSASVVGMLDGLTSDYETFDVLSDPEVREGIKEFSNWPTIPQLYVNGEFTGGCDIVQEMFASGELHKALGVERLDPITPTISITDAAAQVLEQARTQQGADGGLHISVSPSFRYSLGFGPQKPGEVAVEANGWQVYVENDSTHRANGLTIGVVEGQLHIENPNEGNSVSSLSVQELQALIRAGEEFELIDVRSPEERELAVIEGSRLLDRNTTAELEKLPADRRVIFYCHTGQRSQVAAQAFASNGHANVYNLMGGIDAWSTEIDPQVPRY
ncbi:MAG: Grx4 family monothiol glutaredoxin [Gemmatimonadetes bacterium]|nr:Grx4 family monothiol glutaredoxin [Gemmatimonadota bacterium]